MEKFANSTLDDIDHKILDALQQNCRITLAELSERVGLSQSPCLRRWKRLEADGLIIGYTAQLDMRKLGRKITAFVQMRLSNHQAATIDAFEQTMRQMSQVKECFLMTGQRDYYLRVQVDDLEAYDSFVKSCLQSIDHIASIDTSFALHAVK
jgi:Lrp/AsnC family leucine-responsive transcriptional regulator